MSSEEQRMADRMQIRDLVDAYAHHADRREPVPQADVFTLDGRVRLFQGDPVTSEPVQTIQGRVDLAAAFRGLMAQYQATTYLNGQSTVTFAGPDHATGEAYCLAMHFLHDGPERVLLTISIRYLDRYIRNGGHWLIESRDLVFDWTDRRPSTP